MSVPSRTLPDHLRQLEAMLTDHDLGDGAMLATELDGLVAGLIVCPDAIAPAEWLAVALGPAGSRTAHASARTDCIRLALAHRDGVALVLAVGERYAPVLDLDPASGELLWEQWADGFGRAMALRPDAWRAVAQDRADEEAATALAGLEALVALATSVNDTDPDAAAVLTQAAPTLIPGWVTALNRRRLRLAARSARCRCGSDRPYGMCCGLN